MRRSGLLLAGCLLLAVTGIVSAAPAPPDAPLAPAKPPVARLSVVPVSLDHPDLPLQSVRLHDWRLELKLPEGWEVEESDDILRFRAPDRLPNCGILFIEDATLTKATFFETIWSDLQKEEGLRPLQAGLAQVGTLGVPIIWAESVLGGDDPAIVRSIIALYEFSPQEFPFRAEASAPASLWEVAQPELEAILGHITAIVSEEDEFAGLEHPRS